VVRIVLKPQLHHRLNVLAVKVALLLGPIQRVKLVDLLHHVMHRARKHDQPKSLARDAQRRVVVRLLVDQAERDRYHAHHLGVVTCQLQLRLVF
jgi:hypothetical protein